jgi:hypothetical protein
MSKNHKNKLKTAGYFIKRLKDAGYVVLRIFDKYSDNDPRKWTILVDPSGSSIFITCFEDRPFKGEYLFSLDDGNQLFRRGYAIKTSSIEVILQLLSDRDISLVEDNEFVTKYKKYE